MPPGANLTQWAANLRDARKDRGISQMDLAEMVGVSRASIVRWEAGETAPRDHVKVALAEALDRAPYDLFPLSRSAV